MYQGGYILYIELIALGSYCSVDVEPMNVFHVAVMKNASRVILVHNHLGGSLIPSPADKDITDRLIQVSRIVNIEFVDHFMDELEQSLKYVPTYQVVEMIRKEEKKIAKEKLAVANDKIKAEKERREKLELATATALLSKGVSIQDIAKIMDLSVRKVKEIVGKTE